MAGMGFVADGFLYAGFGNPGRCMGQMVRMMYMQYDNPGDGVERSTEGHYMLPAAINGK